LFIGPSVFGIEGLDSQQAGSKEFRSIRVGNMHSIAHSLFSFGTLLAVLITAGVAVLLFCCLSCSSCGCKEKDDLFRRKSA
jgi:hypothetical protein